MLVLDIIKDKTLYIGKDIELCFLAKTGSAAKLGIKAPEHICIHREEVYQRILEERKNGTITNKTGSRRSRNGNI